MIQQEKDLQTNLQACLRAVRLLSFPRSILGASFAADRLSFSAWHFLVKVYYVAKGEIDCRRWFRIEEMLWVV